MKIVILEGDTIGADVDLSIFKQFGDTVIYGVSTPYDTAEKVKDADIVLVNKQPMNEATLKDAAHLKLICVTATGTNNIDKEYIRKRGITVTNVAGYSTDSVVQHTFALLFYVLEKLKYFDEYVKSGAYCDSPIFTNLDRRFFEISGKTWGIIGMGTIGQKVASIAGAFGCHVIYYSTTGKNTQQNYECVSFKELLRRSDIVSVHAPLTEETEGLMDYEAFSLMKREAVFINVGRGPIVKEEDLLRALSEKLIAGAGLDVICTEPMEKGSPLLSVQDSDRLVITPHIAWASNEARQRLIDETAENINAFLKGEKRNVVE